MNRSGHGSSSRKTPAATIAELRARLDEAEETLRAIRSGGVDALVVAGEDGPRVYTLEGAEHAYRLLVESMNEGALMLSADSTILYANLRFARMLNRPLTRVIGHSLRRFVREADRGALTSSLAKAAKPRRTIQVMLRAVGPVQVPAQLSVRRLEGNGRGAATFSVVVTDMTEARRSEKLLRHLSQGLLQAQEADHRRLALELHDRTSQNLVVLLFRLHVLAGHVPARARALRQEVAGIDEMLRATAEVVESISRQLRPSVLEIMGLVPAQSAAIAEFTKRTGIAVRFDHQRAPGRLSAPAALVLYRILEEALRNVERHAGARNVTVRLGQRGGAVELVIRDNGVGFDPHQRPAGEEEPGGTGLLALSERAASVGGALRIRSAPDAGTEITTRIPLSSPASG